MKYYKAINNKDMFFEDRLGWSFIKNELLTEKELTQCCERNKWNFDKLVNDNFTVVEIPKSQTYWCFWGRFA